MQKTSEEATEATETDKTIEDAATVTEPVKEEGTAKETEPAKANSKKKAIIIAAVVVALVACGLLAWFLVDQHNKQVWEQEHKAYPVNLTLVAEGYDSSTSTPIPVQIEGTDLEGNSVSTETLVGSNGAEPISLMRGNYTLSVTASPISEDGTMFDVSQQWVGKVDWSIDGDSISVYPKGYPEASLIGIHTTDPDAQVNEGDIAGAMVYREVNGQCAVELWRSNWIYMAAEHELSGVSYGISDNALYATLVELISGGSVTYDDIAADPDKYFKYSLDYTFVEDTIAPTVVVKDVPPAG